jgi:uncharacterized membrane protein YidH (DUF202 family)
MSDNKSIELTVGGGGQKSSDHDHKSNDNGNHPRQRHYAHCLLVVTVILLALTAQIFRKEVFSEPHFSNAVVEANCTGLTAPACQTYVSSDYGCFLIANDDGNSCGPSGFSCWQGKCVSGSDSANSLFCNNPPDSRCAATDAGVIKGDRCHYNFKPDYTRCHPKYGAVDTNDTVLLGWSCQDGECVSPVKQLVGNNAYQWSISAGLVSAALATEILVTGSFTPDLAFLAINSGLILLGFDGKLQDLSLEFNGGLGRTQIAFGFLLGALAFIFSGKLLGSKSSRDKPKTIDLVFAVILIFFHGCTIGLVARLWTQDFDSYDQGDFQSNTNISTNWAYPASIYAAAVALAVAFTIFYHGKPTNGFGALTLVTGVVELAWASANVDEDSVGVDDFTGTANAWHSFAIMAAVFSILFGFYFTVSKKSASVDDRAQSKTSNRGLAFLTLIAFCTMIGIVASLYQNAFLDAEAGRFGTNPRISDFATRTDDNYLNQVSSFAWEHSIFAALVASASAIEILAFGSGSGGIVALTVINAANLIGWAAYHTYVGSITVKEELAARTRAWAALALVAGAVALLASFHALRSQSGDDNATKPTDEHNSIDAADRDQFVTKGQP